VNRAQKGGRKSKRRVRQRQAEIQHQTQAVALETHIPGRKQVITQNPKAQAGRLVCKRSFVGLRRLCFIHSFIQPFTRWHFFASANIPGSVL